MKRKKRRKKEGEITGAVFLLCVRRMRGRKRKKREIEIGRESEEEENEATLGHEGR